jgi:hypothetical protein
MILTAKVKIKGTRSLLYHCFTPDSIPLEKKERTGVAGNDPEEWKRTFTANPDGQLYLNATYVFGCLRDAAKYTKSGRGSIQSKIAATLQISNEKVLINRYIPKNLDEVYTEPSQDVYLDIQSVRNPATKGRNVRYRLALSSGWEAEFTLLWENTLVNRTQMEAVCRDAGTLVGLADGRSIGFGRFEMISFTIDEDAEKTTA